MASDLVLGMAQHTQCSHSYALDFLCFVLQDTQEFKHSGYLEIPYNRGWGFNS